MSFGTSRCGFGIPRAKHAMGRCLLPVNDADSDWASVMFASGSNAMAAQIGHP